jgi:hypothetical protein
VATEGLVGQPRGERVIDRTLTTSLSVSRENAVNSAADFQIFYPKSVHVAERVMYKGLPMDRAIPSGVFPHE